jgi:outer membrane protein OmpA-like peptidoglycan-associated protein
MKVLTALILISAASLLGQPAASEKPQLQLRGMRVNTEPVPPEVAVQILFKFGSTEIADAFSRNQLDEAGKALSSAALSGFRFEIAGHTDAVGSARFNRELSRQRAAAIKAYLCEHYSIAPARLEIRGYGESQPIASNKTAGGRSRNRRVVFKRLEE